MKAEVKPGEAGEQGALHTLGIVTIIPFPLGRDLTPWASPNELSLLERLGALEG
jgi:hypothetical protein